MPGKCPSGMSGSAAGSMYEKVLAEAMKKYDEATAHAVAMSAVKGKYKKDAKSGKWVKKQSAETKSFAVNLVCRNIQALSRDEMIQLIPNNVLREIKARDPYPTFSVYSICHEGVSQPAVKLDDTKGYNPISWPRAAIQSIKAIALRGVKCFLGHDETNTNRKEYGEIVANCEKEIGGLLHHVAIAYHPPEVRDEAKTFDICSMEAVWDFVKDAGQWVANKIESVTGLALASSKSDRPAFLGARRLGIVQALDFSFENKEKSVVTLQEAKDFVKANDVIPSQLFTLEEIKKDGTFIPAFAEIDKHIGENKSLKEQLEAATKRVQEIGQKEAELNARAIFDKTIDSKELKLTYKQKTFARNKFASTKLTDPSEAGVKSFIEKTMVEFSEYAKIFSDSTITKQNKDVSTKGDSVDYTDPEVNDFLKD